MGATPLEKYEEKVTCGGGALVFSKPEKSQGQINKKYGTKFNTPVT